MLPEGVFHGLASLIELDLTTLQYLHTGTSRYLAKVSTLVTSKALAEHKDYTGLSVKFDFRYQLGPDGSPGSDLQFGQHAVSDGTFSINGFVIPRGYQVWRVPRTAKYDFVLAGAQGSGISASSRGGYGAVVSTSMLLQRGDIIVMVVGIQPLSENVLAGIVPGGGGTFVTKYNATGNFNLETQHQIIAVAGGGGGAGLQQVMLMPPSVKLVPMHSTEVA